MANARLGWFSPLGVAFASEIAARRVDASARRVGLRVRSFRFSARAASEIAFGGLVLPPSVSEIALGGLVLPLGGLAFGLTASAFRHAPLRSCPRRVGLRAHRFRFSVRTASEIPLGELVFGLTVSAFRHAPFRRLPSAGWFFRSASWPSGSPLPLFGTHRFGDCRWASSFFRLPLWKLPSAGWPSGSLLPFFGTRRFGVAAGRVGLRAHCFRFSACADPHRRAAEARTDGAHRHDNCFTSKHLSQHVNLPHRTP